MTGDLSRDDFLGGQVRLWQPRDGYRAGMDAVLLAASCPVKQGQSVLDLGCGAGAASLCVRARVDVALTGVELQEDYAELCRKNAGDAMEVICADVAELPVELRLRSFDHVILNPPYYGPGAPASDIGRETALREDTALSVWVETALRRAGPKGIVTLVHMADRLGDLIAMLNSRAGLLEIKPIAPRVGKSASRVLLRLHKGRAARTILYNPLVLHEGDAHMRDGDSFTTEAKSVLRDGNSLKF